MALTRPKTDECAFNTRTQESIKPLSYVLQIDAHENCEMCGDKPNAVNLIKRVDIESDLFGLNRTLSNNLCQSNNMVPLLVEETKNYNPPFLCERNLSHPSFVSTANPNNYMEKLRTSKKN